MTARFAPLLAVCALALAVTAAPAAATEPITSFGVTTSTHRRRGPSRPQRELRAGGTGLAGGGGKRQRQPAARASSGTPTRSRLADVSDFALMQCPADSQAGTVTVRANYSGEPELPARHRPGLRHRRPGRGRDRSPRLHRPPAQHPDRRPDPGPHRIRLRPADDGRRHHPADAAGGREDDRLGLPGGDEDTTTNASCRDRRATRRAAPGSASALCASNNGQAPHDANLVEQPFTDNPSVCTGTPLTVSLDVRTYQDPTQVSHAEDQYPPTTGCEYADLQAGASARVSPRRRPTRRPGIDITLDAPPSPRAARPRRRRIRSAIVVLPEGLSINPDAADGQTACTDAQANFGSEGPAHCPDSSKIGRFDIAHAGPRRPAHRLASTSANRSPATSTGCSWSPSGFGINAKIVAAVRPDPATGRLTRLRRRPPAGPFEEFNLHLFASDRGLIATPTRCTIYHVDSLFVPWNARLAATDSQPDLQHQRRAGRHGPAPGRSGPSTRDSWPAPSNPLAGGFSAFTLKLDRDDGDQFLGDLNFTMPPGLHRRRCAGSPTARRRRSGGRRAARPRRAGDPELSAARARSAPRTSPPAPGRHPFHAVGKMYLAGPFKGAPLEPGRGHPGAGRALRLRRRRWSGSRSTSIRSTPRSAPSPTRCRRSSAASRSGCARSRSTSTGRTSRSIRPTAAPFSVDSQGIGDQGTVADFSSYFQAVNCATLPFKPKMTVRQLGRRRTRAAARTRGCSSTSRTRPGDANIKSLSVTLPKAFADRPAPPRQHLLRERAGRRTVRRPHSRSARRRRRRRCSTSRSRAPSTRSPAPAACRAWPSSSTARST